MTRRATCPQHPGIIIDRHAPCYRCHPEEASVEETTVSIRTPEGWTDPVSLDGFTKAVDRITGELAPVQPTLDDTVFPPVRRKDIPVVKLGFTGSVEMTVSHFLKLLDGDDLRVGAIVQFTGEGHIKKVGTGWKKRSEGTGEDKMTWWEQEGLPGIAVDGVQALKVTARTWSE